MLSEDDYFKLLGRISVLFASLDMLVTNVILKIAMSESEAFDLPSENATLGKKLRFLEKAPISNKFGLDVIDSLSSCLPEAIKIADERNRYIHDQWIFDPATISKGKIDRIRLTSSGLKERTTLSINDISIFERKVAAIQHPFFKVLTDAI